MKSEELLFLPIHNNVLFILSVACNGACNGEQLKRCSKFPQHSTERYRWIYSVLGYCVASQTIVNTYSLSLALLTFGNSAKIASEG